MLGTRISFIKESIVGQSILDIGNLGGDGKLFKELQVMFPQIIGLDNNKRLAKKLNLKNQVIGNADDLPFKDETFDTIIMAELLEHTYSPQSFISEAKRVLKTNGLLILTTPNPYALHRILRFLLKREDSIGDEDHKLFYTPNAIERLLKGFKVEITSDKLNKRYLPSLRMLGGHLCVKAIKKDI
ncbi:MAG: class I SAM-dependent methyltransferase [Patescibacteria group bacterium]|nr:class I SAM-dependent methyltransferase [Patescibacteria group bacterium]